MKKWLIGCMALLFACVTSGWQTAYAAPSETESVVRLDEDGTIYVSFPENEFSEIRSLQFDVQVDVKGNTEDVTVEYEFDPMWEDALSINEARYSDQTMHIYMAGNEQQRLLTTTEAKELKLGQIKVETSTDVDVTLTPLKLQVVDTAYHTSEIEIDTTAVTMTVKASENPETNVPGDNDEQPNDGSDIEQEENKPVYPPEYEYDGVNTGDNSNSMLYGLLMSAGVVGILIAYVMYRKKNLA